MSEKQCKLYAHEEQVKAAGHIAFEILHFRTYSLLKDNRELGALCPAASQAVGYTLLLHLRVLMDFYFSEPVQDDFHVCHFRLQPGFTKAFPPSIHERTDRTVEVTRHLNKLLAHFTATRWKKDRPDWKYYNEYAPVVADLNSKFEAALQGEVKAAYEAGYRMWLHHSPTVKPRDPDPLQARASLRIELKGMR
ncbi:MAG TPA: hypothetical protein VGN17_00310 [Bryobacteraceae bacterium]|jgi:hypothetical protein